MAATLNILSSISGTVKGHSIKFGSQTTPITLTLSTDNLTDDVKTLSNNTTYTVWSASASTEPITSFSLLAIVTDVDMLVELTCDVGNDVGTKQLVLKAKANIPLLLGSNYSIANYTNNFGGGTADVIDQIRVRNESGGSGTVRILLAV
jgi:hypothetical protein